MGYIGMCRCEGYDFQAVYSRIGYINQSVWVQNRVSFFRKLISWLKILSRLLQLLQDRGIWGVYSSIGQQNSAELALVQVKCSRVPAAHPHPEIPKVPPPGILISIILQSFSLYKFQHYQFGRDHFLHDVCPACLPLRVCKRTYFMAAQKIRKLSDLERCNFPNQVYKRGTISQQGEMYVKG